MFRTRQDNQVSWGIVTFVPGDMVRDLTPSQVSPQPLFRDQDVFSNNLAALPPSRIGNEGVAVATIDESSAARCWGVRFSEERQTPPPPIFLKRLICDTKRLGDRAQAFPLPQPSFQFFLSDSYHDTIIP